MAAYTQGRPLTEIVLAETMSNAPVACAPGDDVADVHELMKWHQIRRIPVLDEERHPVGIITLSDLARSEDTTQRGQALVDTFAAVSQPRRSVALVSAA